MWLAWIAVGVATAVTAVVVWHSSGPALLPDELGILGPARILARPSTEWGFAGAGYMPGTSVILAPLWWFSDDPAVVYRASIVICGVLSLALMYPLTRLGETLGVARSAALLASAVVTMAPGHAIYANYVWSEQALSLAVAFALWRGIVVSRETNVRNAVLFGAAAAGTFVTHGRAVAFTAVAGLALIAIARRSRRPALWGVATYVGVVTIGLALFHWTSTRLYDGNIRVNGTLGDLSNGTIADVFDTAASQSWYQVAAWVGLVTVGGGFLVSRAWVGADSTWARWALAGFGAVFLFGIAFVSGSEPTHLRLDLHVYGRYFDGFSATLAGLGLMAIIIGLSTRMAVLCAAFTLALTISFLALTVPGIPPGGWWEPAHLPGIAHMMSVRLVATGTPEPWGALASVMCLAALAVLVVARRRGLVVGMIAVYFATVTLVVDQMVIKDRESGARQPWGVPAAIETLPSTIPLAVDIQGTKEEGVWIGRIFWTSPRNVVFFNSTVEAPPSVVVLAAPDWAQGIAAGALPLEGTWWGNELVWVFPGEYQKALVEAGIATVSTTDNSG